MKQGTITLAGIKTSAKPKEKTASPPLPVSKQNDKTLSREAWLKRKAKLKEIRKLLHETYPTVFDYTSPKPLEIGIDQTIVKAHPQFSRKIIRLFLKKWVKDTRYLQSLSSSTHRVNLQCECTEEIKASHRDFSAQKSYKMKAIMRFDADE